MQLPLYMLSRFYFRSTGMCNLNAFLLAWHCATCHWVWVQTVS